MNGVGSQWRNVPVLMALVSALGCGAVKEKQVIQAPPAYAEAKVATAEELVDLINVQYAQVDSITVKKCEVEFTGGSIEDGYLEKYRKANGMLIAKEPDSIYLTITNPLTNSTVVAMASMNEQFQIWIPSKNTFVTGRTDIESKEDNPMHNVRPSHVLEGILVQPIPVDDPRYGIFVVEDQDAQFRYYELDVVELGGGPSTSELLRRVWIERSTMRLKKQTYYRGGQVVSTITYADPVILDGGLVNTRVHIERPLDRYAISFKLESDYISLGSKLKSGEFELPRPPGAETVVVD